MHDSKPGLNRVVMDSMLIMLLLGLLALPILTIGMTGYKNNSDVLGAEVAEVAVVEVEEPAEVESTVEIRSFKMRVGSGPEDSDESTESVRGIQDVPRMTEDF